MDLCRREGIHPGIYYKLVAELSLKNRKLKKNLAGFGIRISRYMEYSQPEKMEIIRMVEESNLSVRRTLQQIDISRSTFYQWYKRYQESGYDGLASRHKRRVQFWNAIPEWEKARVVEVAREYPEKSCREVAFHITDKEGYFISGSSRFRIPG